MKLSYNAADNGYAVFENVRIPRSNLLMKLASVSRDGTYTSVPLRQKLLYGGMMNGRRVMIGHVAFQLAQVCYIIFDYNIVVFLSYNRLLPLPLVTQSSVLRA